MSTKTFPTLNSEQAAFAAGYSYLLGIDEVGRGALAGPVSVGISVIDQSRSQTPWPITLQDSKLLSEPKREALFEPVQSWVLDWAVGSASAIEVDELGIVQALKLAGGRAFTELCSRLPLGESLHPTAGILDGSHNWLASELPGVAVKTIVKADRDCVSVAAASVLAKVVRDRQLIAMAAMPGLGAFDLAGNKGYSSPRHLEALREFGPSAEHRKTWLGKILGTDYLF